MSSTRLYRLTGIALLASGVLSVIGFGIGSFQNDNSPAALTSAPYYFTSLLTFLGAALAVLGLPGMIARQADRAGVLGLIGGVSLTLVQLIFGIGNGFVNLTIFPPLVSNPATRAFALGAPPPAMGAFFMVGMALEVVAALAMGIATLRAHVFPRWIGILFLVTLVAEIPSSFLELPYLSNLAPIIASVAAIGVGYVLMSPRRTPVAQPVRAPVAAEI